MRILKEEIIKSKIRVQKHGEVFTPKKIVNKMLEIYEIKEACENIFKKFLEPSAGEGAFLIAILQKKLEKVEKDYNNNLAQFENYSLLALTTLYGIELLKDNAQTCVMNLFQTYYDFYQKQAMHHNNKVKKKVLNSAKEIISANIEQGNFLTRRRSDGTPLIFSEWLPVNLKKNAKNIKIQRTEYTLDEIYKDAKKQLGQNISTSLKQDNQLNIFDLLEDDESEIKFTEMRYTVVFIVDIYKVEMEEI